MEGVFAYNENDLTYLILYKKFIRFFENYFLKGFCETVIIEKNNNIILTHFFINIIYFFWILKNIV